MHASLCIFNTTSHQSIIKPFSMMSVYFCLFLVLPWSEPEWSWVFVHIYTVLSVVLSACLRGWHDYWQRWHVLALEYSDIFPKNICPLTTVLTAPCLYIKMAFPWCVAALLTHFVWLHWLLNFCGQGRDVVLFLIAKGSSVPGLGLLRRISAITFSLKWLLFLFIVSFVTVPV